MGRSFFAAKMRGAWHVVRKYAVTVISIIKNCLNAQSWHRRVLYD